MCGAPGCYLATQQCACGRGNTLAPKMVLQLTTVVTIIFLSPLSIFANFYSYQGRDKVPRYSIITKFMSAGSLTIYIYTAEESIEENKLRLLLKHFFKKYRRPNNVVISIFTHQSQLRDLGRIDVPEPNEEAKKHPSALITRIDGKESIGYTLPGFNSRTIIVKERKENNKQ